MTLTDPLIRSRKFWGGVVWVIAGLLTALGGGYLIAGTRITPLVAAYASVSHIPGGIHTYGGAMALVGLALIHGLLPTRGPMDVDWLHAILLGVVVLCACVDIGYALSWIYSSAVTYVALIYWTSVGTLAVLAAKYPPASDGAGRDS